MLEARNLHKIYNHSARQLHVLRGVDLKVGKGEFIAVLGPSGAGKTTLIHLLGGLDYPSQGRVFLGSQEIYALTDYQLADLRNRKIGFVFQFYHLLPEFNALENVLLPALISGGRRDTAKNAKELLGLVGLGQRCGHFPAQLSGGEQQRLAIARALVNCPELLFCDEPTGNLDSQTGKEIIGLIRQLNQTRRMTVVLVTHNQEISGLADKLLYLKDGKLEKSI